MSNWISCIKCNYKYKDFIRVCPKCDEKPKSLDKYNEKDESNYKFLGRNNSKDNKKILILFGIAVFTIITSIAVSSNLFSNSHPPMILQLKEYALKKITEDRAKYSLPPVQLSYNYAAQAHADELLKTETLSHWTLDGMKPYMRYSVYGGNDSVAQNVAQEKYGMVSDTIWNIGNENPSTDIEGQIQMDLCKMGIPSCLNTIDNPLKAIDNLEYKMMYDDLEDDNGHRYNILDGNHTHVSLGIAYNKFYFALVQNFENKDTIWNKPVAYNNITEKVSLSGQIKEPNANFSEINISYDPLPSKQTYDDNHDRKSYDGGKEIAWVVKKVPSYYYGSRIKLDSGSNIELIPADKWNSQNQNPKSIFDISFPLQKLVEKHGKGVYTVNTFYDKDGIPIQATSKSIFVNK